jgi:hypothetical protein
VWVEGAEAAAERQARVKSRAVRPQQPARWCVRAPQRPGSAFPVVRLSERLSRRETKRVAAPFALESVVRATPPGAGALARGAMSARRRPRARRARRCPERRVLPRVRGRPARAGRTPLRAARLPAPVRASRSLTARRRSVAALTREGRAHARARRGDSTHDATCVRVSKFQAHALTLRRRQSSYEHRQGGGAA